MVEGGSRFAHILVVDDDMDVGQYVARLLERRGHRVTCVGLGNEALVITRHIRPDVIILDVELPDVSGFDVCKQLRDEARTADIPIVMMSGARAACSDCLHGFECGADEYLEKPFVSDIFLFTVERFLASRSH